MQQQSTRAKVIGAFLTLILAAGTLQAATWTSTVGGDWDTASNWDTDPTVPNNVDVIFGNAINSNSIVNMATDRTVTALTINNSNFAYTLDGPGTLTIQGQATLVTTVFDLDIAGAAGHEIKTNLILEDKVNYRHQTSGGVTNISGNVHFADGAELHARGTSKLLELSGSLSGDVYFSLYADVTLSGKSTLTQQLGSNRAHITVVDGADISIDVGGTGTAWLTQHAAGSYKQTGGTVNLNNGLMQLGSNQGVTGRISGGTLTAGDVLVHTTDGKFAINGGAVNLAGGVVDATSRTANFEFTGGTLTATSDNFKLQNLKGGETTTYHPVTQDATDGDSLLDLSGYNAAFDKTAYTAAVSSGGNTATVRLGGTGKTLTLSATDLNGDPTRLTIGNQAFLVGEGTVTGGGGVLIADGGTVAPGNSPGTMTIDNHEIAGGGAARFDIWGTAPGEFDQIAGTNLTLNDGWILELNFKRIPTGSYDLLLFDYDNVTGSEFAPEYVYLNGSSATGVDFQWVDGGGHLTFTSAIPEPSSLLLLGMAGLLLMRRRRR